MHPWQIFLRRAHGTPHVASSEWKWDATLYVIDKFWQNSDLNSREWQVVRWSDFEGSQKKIACRYYSTVYPLLRSTKIQDLFTHERVHGARWGKWSLWDNESFYLLWAAEQNFVETSLRTRLRDGRRCILAGESSKICFIKRQLLVFLFDSNDS